MFAKVVACVLLSLISFANGQDVCSNLASLASGVYQVIIVGGGPAGMAAAVDLYKHGKITNITIVEARDRLGGRVHTVTEAGNPLEMGAQYIHWKKGNVVYKFANDNDLLVDEDDLNDDVDTYYLQSGVAVDTDLAEQMRDLFDNETAAITEENNSKLSIGQQLKNKIAQVPNLSEGARLVWWTKYMDSASDYGDDLMTANVNEDAMYGETEGNQFNVPASGYMAIFSKLMEGLPETLRQLSSPVKSVYWGLNCQGFTNMAAVQLQNGRFLLGQYVVLTVPLGVLKSNSITFQPPLPTTKTDAISRLGFGCIAKVFIRWDKSWWPANTSLVGLAIDSESRLPTGVTVTDFLYTEEEDKNWYRYSDAFNTVYNQNETLESWYYGKWARVVETLPESEIQNVLMQLMRIYFGKAYNNIPNPVKTIRTAWCNDQYTKGAYMGLNMQSRYEDIKTLAAPLPNADEPSLLFAGEATHEKYWATVHGAVQTGYRASGRIIDLMKD